MKDLIDKLINAGIEENEAKKEISILEKEFKDQNKIQQIVNERIKTRKPIQYLISKAFFMDFEVAVSPSVLIPRPETEILVEETIKRIKRKISRNDIVIVLDIGTGSGIIPIALCKLIPNVRIIAIDIEDDIIELAKENAKKNAVENKISFKVCDLFSDSAIDLLKSNNFDLIISNPPYIKESEMQKLHRGEITSLLKPELLHEPRIALLGSKENKTGLIYYQRIIELVKKYWRHCEERSDEAISLRKEIASPLARNDVKLLALEIDPPLINDLKNLLKKEGLTKFEIIKDYGKLDRCLFVYL